jgi:hypothetical protein
MARQVRTSTFVGRPRLSDRAIRTALNAANTVSSSKDYGRSFTNAQAGTVDNRLFMSSVQNEAEFEFVAAADGWLSLAEVSIIETFGWTVGAITLKVQKRDELTGGWVTVHTFGPFSPSGPHNAGKLFLPENETPSSAEVPLDAGDAVRVVADIGAGFTVATNVHVTANLTVEYIR